MVNAQLDRSYEHCYRVTRSRAKNFYYAMRLMPRSRRRAMFALYAFMRHSDDICDGPEPVEQKRRLLADWRTRLEQALDGDPGPDPVFPALVDTVTRHDIPRDYLRQLIEGVEMDLGVTRYERFDDLYAYCFRVASVVGLCCIHIWGFTGTDAPQLAEWRGVAFQLTNILRDLREDHDRGRVYLPREDLDRFGYTEADLAGVVVNPAFRELMAFEVDRARHYYERSGALERSISPSGRPALAAMTAIYRTLLEQIGRQSERVFRERVRLGTAHKVGLAARAWCRWRLTPWRT